MTSEQIKSQEITNLFHRIFKENYKTIIVKGEYEPFYKAAKSDCAFHEIIYANDSLSSLLHELSHWFIAGNARRMQDDYGYWYLEKRKTNKEQNDFFKSEVKPQALEWILSMAADHHFQFSIDNFYIEELTGIDKFKSDVLEQVKIYLNGNIEKRAKIFIQELQKKYQSDLYLSEAQFNLCQNLLLAE